MNAELLHSEDLLHDGKWQQMTATIAEVIAPGTFKGSDSRPIDKESIRFEKHPKVLVLNSINRRILQIAAGTCVPGKWVGTQVKLYVATATHFGLKDCPGLRIRAPKGATLPYNVRQQLDKETDITGRAVHVATRDSVEKASAASTD